MNQRLSWTIGSLALGLLATASPARAGGLYLPGSTVWIWQSETHL